MTVTIYQIHVTDQMADQINAGTDVPAYNARRNLMVYGPKKFEAEMFEFFTPVYKVDVDDLDDAFEVTNLWNTDTVERLNGPAASSSVGDIFEMGGTFYMVAAFGFEEISV